MQQMLPSNLHEPQQQHNHQQAPVIQPATVNWAGATRKDPAMEDLVEQMSKMTAHIGDLKRQIDAQRPVQRFMANPTPATGSNAYPMGTLRCYRCNQEGHTSRDCSQPDTRVRKRCGEKGHSA